MIGLNFLCFFEDATQFGIDHFPLYSIMNVQDVNKGVREDDNDYISGYRIIWDSEKVGKYKQLLTDEYSTNQLHSFEQCYNAVNLDGALNIIENVYKCAARETDMTKAEGKCSTRRHDKTVPWWDIELQQIKSLINKCLTLY